MPRIQVSATIACAATDSTVSLLRNRARAADFKWKDVSGFVRTRDSLDAIKVRARLGEASIAVVDPAAYVRTDSFAPRRGGRSVPYLSREMYATPELAPFVRAVHRSIARALVITSGAESLYSLLNSPGLGDVDVRVTDEELAAVRKLDPLTVVDGWKSLTKAARLALQSAAIVAHEHDAAGRAALVRNTAMFRWNPEGALNHARLMAISSRTVVFDRGHEQETGVLVKLHEAARRRVSHLPWWMDESGEESELGSVRTGESQREIELRMADVAAGWACDVLAERGAFELCKEFRLVIYNGVALSPERAKRLDDERRFFRRIVSRA